MLYIPSTQGRLFRSESDEYIRNSNGRKLKFVSNNEEDKFMKDEDLKELVFVNYLAKGIEEQKIDEPVIELYYTNNRKEYLVEEEW